MIDLEGQHVELLPARTTLTAGGGPVGTATGGSGGNGGGLNVLSGIAVGILNSGPVVASAGQGGQGGSAANVFGG